MTATARRNPDESGPVPFRRLGTAPRSFSPAGSLLPAFEHLLLFIAVVAFFGITQMPSDAVGALSASNPLNTIFMTMLLLVAAPALCLYGHQAARLVIGSPLLMAFVAIAIGSVFWSDYPWIAARRVGTLIVPLACALVVALRYSPEEIIIRIGRILLVLCLVSAFLALAVPSIGVMHRALDVDGTSPLAGSWRGVTSHKNTLGYVAILCAQVYGWRLFSEPNRRAKNALIVILIAILAWKTKSQTSLVAVLLSLIMLSVLTARRRTRGYGSFIEFLFLSAISAVIVLAPLLFATFANMLGKDATLTGRIPLWHTLLAYVHERPWFGFGYGTFFVDESANIARLNEIVGWQPPNAHNAYLDLVLSVGIVGAVIATAFLLTTTFRLYRLARANGPSWTMYAATFCFVFTITNLIDTMLLKSGDIYCFLLALCHFTLLKFRLDARDNDNTVLPNRAAPFLGNRLSPTLAETQSDHDQEARSPDRSGKLFPVAQKAGAGFNAPKNIIDQVDAWKRVAMDLGVEVVAPCEIHLRDGRRLQATALLRQFGGANGMIVDPSWERLEPYAHDLIADGYAFSCTTLKGSDRSDSIPLLREWEWSSSDPSPEWLQ